MLAKKQHCKTVLLYKEHSDNVGCLFLRATNFADFVDFGDFHEICFSEN